MVAKSFLAFVASLAATAAATAPNADKVPRAGSRPNIIFILTDDQDMRMDSLNYMGGVQNHLISQGTTYQRHYYTVALCCPSRVNLWTGRAAHNTNVTDLSPPYGGYEKFVQEINYTRWLPNYMQEAGYNTYYVGKLVNSFSEKNYNEDGKYIQGLNGSDFLIGAATYNYYNPMYQRNYSVDLTFNKSMAFLDDARAAGGPFFLTMATVGCHSGWGPRPGSNTTFGPVPRADYAHLFPNVEVPKTANFNPSVESGTSWVAKLPLLPDQEIEYNHEYYRQRLRALQSVDDLVNGTIAYLEQHNLLDNTYIIYSSDNGFHISQHRLHPGKNCPYEEDINVPLIIRGPGIEAGSSVSIATSHTDIAPTILKMAGATLPEDLDGAAVPEIDSSSPTQTFEHAQIEHWGDAGKDDGYPYPTNIGTENTTYKALRLMGENSGKSYNLFYSVWCNNDHELYDMSSDEGQMDNLYAANSTNTVAGFPINRLESRLDALLLVLKSCKRDTCREPWTALHPQGNVQNLMDAMNPQYDDFYENEQPKVSFSSCQPGYLIWAEGPQTFLAYQAHQNRYGF